MAPGVGSGALAPSSSHLIGVCETQRVSDSSGFRVHLIDGTYELFRQHYGQAGKHGDESPFAATVGVLSSTLQLLSQGATHMGVASDHIIESFRNDLWACLLYTSDAADE